jgi:hypothetical protein
LRHAKELGYEESVLYTNGTRLSRQVVKSLRPWVDTVAIHLDTLSPRLFSQVHYDKDLVETTHKHTAILEGFQNLLAGGFAPDDIRLTLTLSRPVLGGLPRLLYWAFQEMGFQTSVFLPIISFGRAVRLSRQWFLTANQIAWAYQLRAQTERRSYLLSLGVAEYCKQYQMTMCYLRADGLIAAYAGGQPVCGSVLERDIGQLMANHYDNLAFRAYSDGVNNFPQSGSCWECVNQKYCFGNPICADRCTCPFTSRRRAEHEG